MCADGGDAAVFEHDGAGGAANGGEPVRDDDDGATLHEVAERDLDERFALGVESGGGFVEDEDGGVLQDGAGDGDALAFAAGEAEALFADDGVVALRHAQDEVVGEGVAGGLYDLFGGNIGLAVGDVVAHGVVEEDRLLRDLGDLFAERLESEGANIVAVDEDAAAADVVEARDEIDQRALPCPAGADESEHFADADFEVDVVEDLVLAFFGGVGEADVFEGNLFVKAFEFVGAGAFRGLRLRCRGN